ncbi:siphovirus Gp157 family protein [Virgibacillus sp. Bac332]|uniref:siphovirus Gp157 family protein n=1 Tax=Virgibacillus sp. Bac332 TaxID=2419842 RepID=UPI000EF55A8D|nr:siphovirus Gp157 family protein [Virgibacillus sp. Bac332]
MATLYELSQKYSQLLQLAEEADEAAFLDALEYLDEEINEKAENIAFVLQEMKADIDKIGNEIKRLQNRKKTLQNKQDQLKWYLTKELDGLGIDRVKSANFNISLRNNPPKVNVLDESLIPKQYFITKQELSKKDIKEALKNGEEIEGVSLISERSVNIR